MKVLNSLSSSRSCGRLLENPKLGGSKELFPSENNLKTSSTVNFLKNIQILEPDKPIEDTPFFHIPFYLWTPYNIKLVFGLLIGTSSKCYTSWE